MRKYILLIILLVIISGCAQETLEPRRVEEPQEEILLPSPEEPSRFSEVEGVKVIKMTARQWEFVPSEIELNAGDKVKLEIDSEDINHGIIIKDFDIQETIEPGMTTIIQFTVDEPGEYEFKSSIYSGLGFQNMKGKIIVI